MMLYFILTIILLIVLYFLLPSNKYNKRVDKNPMFKLPNFYNNVVNNTVGNPICGRKNLYCKNNLVRPYMFRNLAKEYVDNSNIDWNIEILDKEKNLYRMSLSEKYCAYNIDNDICLFELENSSEMKIENKNEDKAGCKKINLCSLSNAIDSTPHYDPDNSQFIINKVTGLNTPEDGYTIQSLDGNYICNINNRMSVSSTFSDDCVWQFK